MLSIKKIVLCMSLISVVSVSAVCAGTKVVINNQLNVSNADGSPWVSGDFVTKNPSWNGSFNNIPNGNDTISSQWPTSFSGATIADIKAYYIDKSAAQRNLVASPSCKNIKIIPGVTNVITVTAGTISPFGFKMPATFCAVRVEA